jgi:hypothetical protein
VIVTYLIPLRCTTTYQGEHVSSLTLLTMGGGKCGKECGKDATVVWLDGCSTGRVAV